MTLKPFDFDTHTIARHPDAQFREVGDEIFLVHPDGEQMQNLNPMAAALWRLLEEPMTGRDMAEVVLAAFPIMSPAKIQVDIETVINGLLAGGYAQIKK
ncbi:PqqD family protein [Pseudomonadota bacterium]